MITPRTLASTAESLRERGIAEYRESRGRIPSSIAICPPLEIPKVHTMSGRLPNLAASVLSQRASSGVSPWRRYSTSSTSISYSRVFGAVVAMAIILRRRIRESSLARLSYPSLIDQPALVEIGNELLHREFLAQ